MSAKLLKLRSTGRTAYGQIIETVTIKADDVFDRDRRPSLGHFWDHRLKAWRTDTPQAGQVPPYRPSPSPRPCCAYCCTDPRGSTCVNCGAPQT